MTGINESGHEAEEWASGGSRPSEAPIPSDAPFRGPTEHGVVGGEVIDAEASDSEDSVGESEEGVVGGVAVEDGIVEGEVIDGDPVSMALAQRDEYLDSLRRLQAEFENYKKRVTKQQADQMARAALSLVEKLLPVLDTLDLATEHIGDADSADGRALVATSNQLRDVLAKEGLERLDPIGEEFDPNDHQAVGHVPADEGGAVGAEVPDGEPPADDRAPDEVGVEPVVAQVMRAGYRWRGAIVRPAMVMVRG
jgi:molecular chaperone GrpE